MRLYGTRRRGSVTGLAASVADVVELKRLQTSGGFADRTLIYVEATNAIYAYDRQATSTENVPAVVAPNNGVGRWNLVSGGSGGGITLPSGTNGQLLSLNDAEPTGLEWVDPPSGPEEALHVHNKYADTSAVVGPNQSVLAYEEFNIFPGVDVEFSENSELVILTDGGTGGGGGGVSLPLAVNEGGTGETTAEEALAALGGIPADTVSNLGDLIVGTGTSTVLVLAAGTNGQLLAVNDAEPTGLEWVDPPVPATIPVPSVDGQVLTANTAAAEGYEWADVPSDIPTPASNGQVLTANDATALGYEWAAPPTEIPAPSVDGQILTANALAPAGYAWADAPVEIPTPNINGQVLTANDAVPAGYEWADSPTEIPAPTVDGQVLTANALAPAGYEWADAALELPVPASNGQVLTANDAIPAGYEWADVPAEIPTPASNGQVLTANDAVPAGYEWADAPIEIPAPSTDGQVLTANVLAPSGYEWADIPAEVPVPSSNGQVLTANDAVPAGYEWAAPAAPPTPAHDDLTNLSWTASGHTAPSAAVAGFDAGGAPVAVAPSSGYLVLTSKNGVLSWAPYALGLAFSLSTGEDMADLVVSSPVLITTGTFT